MIRKILSKKRESGPSLEWSHLNSLQGLEEITTQSNTAPVVIFKHSTRCSISTMALNRLNKGGGLATSSSNFYYLDLISHRDISNEIEKKFGVRHESPQVLVLDGGKVVYHASHGAINPSDLQEQIQ